MALDTAQANTPSSASFPKHKIIAVCSHPAVCCELGMDERVHIEGSALWSTVPNNSIEQHGFTGVADEGTSMRGAADSIMNWSHKTSVIGDVIEADICAPGSVCEHITCFCSNGLRIVPRANEHQCSDCGEVVDTDIPPCSCCCHQEECNCCFFCQTIYICPATALNQYRWICTKLGCNHSHQKPWD